MRGFQLWINLPAAEKMKPPAYRDIPAAQMPVHELASGVRLKMIAGRLDVGGQQFDGPIRGLSTEPVYADIGLPAGAVFATTLPADHNAFLYLFEGAATVAGREVPEHHAAVLSRGEALRVEAAAGSARFLLLAGRPIGEPVVQYGPFVMNTMEEIDQALRDYRSGRFTG